LGPRRSAPPLAQDRRPRVVEGHAQPAEHLAGGPLLLPQHAKEEVLDPDPVMTQAASLIYGQLQHLLGARGVGQFAAARPGGPAPPRYGLHLLAYLIEIEAQPGEDPRRLTVGLRRYSQQQVLGPYVLMVEAVGLLPRPPQRIADRLDEVHSLRSGLPLRASRSPVEQHAASAPG